MNLLKTLQKLILGVWIGSIICSGAVVAPTIFKVLDSRTQAGLVFGEVLKNLNQLELGCAITLVVLRVILIILKFIKQKDLIYNFRQKIADVVLLLMICNWFYYAQILSPKVHDLRNQISTFDISIEELEKKHQDALEVNRRKQFDQYHRQYSLVMRSNLFLGVILFFIH
jgi:hypothetical protein